MGDVHMNETKTIVATWVGIKDIPLKPGWRRVKFTDEGQDAEGRQLIGIIDRQEWTNGIDHPNSSHDWVGDSGGVAGV